MTPLAQMAGSGWPTLEGWGLLALLLVNLGTLLRRGAGKDSERQIEPTAIAAIQTELQSQTKTLAKLDREMGAVTSNVDTITREITKIQMDHRIDIRGLHQRIDGISDQLAGTAARVEGLEKREDRA